jgi:hypothetical protein
MAEYNHALVPVRNKCARSREPAILFPGLCAPRPARAVERVETKGRHANFVRLCEQKDVRPPTRQRPGLHPKTGRAGDARPATRLQARTDSGELCAPKRAQARIPGPDARVRRAEKTHGHGRSGGGSAAEAGVEGEVKRRGRGRAERERERKRKRKREGGRGRWRKGGRERW